MTHRAVSLRQRSFFRLHRLYGYCRPASNHTMMMMMNDDDDVTSD